jgi:hypothetical protein
MQAVVAAPDAVVGGLVVVNGVRPAMAAAGAAERAGAAGPGMGRRVAAPSAAGLLLALAAAGVVLGALPGLLTLALALAVGGLQASEQKRRLRPGSSGWPNLAPQVGQMR